MSLSRIRPTQLRVAMVSMHTSPTDQPGIGDAGGLNVYLAQTAARLADAGAGVDVFTRATSSREPHVERIAAGVRLFRIPAGPYAGLRKEDLPGQVCPFTAELLRIADADPRPGAPYDVVHSHYWLSGQAGWLAAQRWSVPLVHSMHTMAKVKNDALAAHDTPEPLMRVVGEEQLVAVADRLVANTADERDELIRHYAADPEQIAVIHPGVDLQAFRPGSRRLARSRAGLPQGTQIVLFVGRIQPLKAPDLMLHAVARLVAAQPWRRDRLLLVICGGLSGNGLTRPGSLQRLAGQLGIADLVRFEPPAPRELLADYFRAADVVAVPSHSESFGLVAVEAQACGTPVLAADVGGLRTSVADGDSGVLVPGHEPQRWAADLAALLDHPGRRRALAAGARRHAERFSWSATAAATSAVYRDAIAQRHGARLAAVP